MKRFRWKLERVLDITARREEALRGELLAVAQEIVRVRERLVSRQAVLRTLLADLGRRDLAGRLAEQSVVMECSGAEQRRIRAIRKELADLEARRESHRQHFRRTRATRRTLERMRAEARQKYLRDMGRKEQAVFDETAHIGFAREAGAAGSPS